MENFEFVNGLKVYCDRKDSSDFVMLQVWFRIGSIDELDSERGMAHLVEHMLFKSTKNFKEGEISKKVEELGGDLNAYTSYDRTVYYIFLPKEHLKEGLFILRDMVFFSKFVPDEFQREREVVLEEVKRSLDNPVSEMSQELFKHRYKGKPAEHPILGYFDQLKAYTRDEVYAFYQKHYTAQRATLLVCGNYESQQLTSAIKNEWQIENNPTAVNFRSLCPYSEIGEESTFVIKRDVKQERFEIAFNAPTSVSPHFSALDLLSHMLSSSPTHSIFTTLKENEPALAVDFGFSSYTPDFGGFAGFTAVSQEGQTERLFKECINQLYQIKFGTHPDLNDENFEQAKTALRVDLLSDRESVRSRARSLGDSLFSPYGLAYVDFYLSSLSNISLDELKKFAFDLIDFDRSVVGFLGPLLCDYDDSTFRGWMRSSLSKLEKKQGHHQKKSTPVSALGQSHSNLETVNLFDGLLKVVHFRDPSTQFVNFSLSSLGGMSHESEQTNGLHHAWSSLLSLASQKYDFDTMQKMLEDSGASLTNFSGKDTFGFRFNGLKESLEPLSDMIVDAMFHPIFPENHFSIHKDEVRETIRLENDRPEKICLREFHEGVYGQHPYAFRNCGSLEFLDGTSTKKLEELYAKSFHSHQWVLGAVSPYSLSQFFEKLGGERAFSELAKKKNKISAEVCRKISASPKMLRYVEKDKNQSHIALGFKGIDWSDQSRLTLELISQILSGQGGRLFINLRDQKSLAYTVSPISSVGIYGGYFGAYIGCGSEKSQLAYDMLVGELVELTKNPPSDLEFIRAKNQLRSQYSEQKENPSSLSLSLGLMELYGVGAQNHLNMSTQIDSLKNEGVMTLAQRLVKLDTIQVSVCGKSPVEI